MNLLLFVFLIGTILSLLTVQSAVNAQSPNPVEPTINGQENVMYQTLLENGTYKLTWPNGTVVSPEPQYLFCEGSSYNVGDPPVEYKPHIRDPHEVATGFFEPCSDGEVRTDQGGVYCTVLEDESKSEE